ncbi:adenylyltransferase and sulfurtransferase [Sphingobacterium lactis]|uniref:Molybdopterin-synthase adenylyltransferase n=1 Tax=Sphingobacterium lactis TaxID=797291 RepID=A0A1H5XZR6_9SPHI|nr:adenylyltransferase and sulfurtransferase [Sphingobacterium lactis]
MQEEQMHRDTKFLRYSRQIFMEEVSILGQKNIAAAKILIVGAGGLGSPIIQYLAAAGVGTLGIVDFDDLELHNLNRQVIHSEQGIGKNKANNAKVFVENLNSSIKVIPYTVRLDAETIPEIAAGYDLIIDGSDNFETRYLVNDFAVQAGIPLVYGSIFAFEGQVAVFNLKGSKHLRDLFPEPPHPEDIQTCDQYGVLGPLPGVVGSLMAMMALKICIGMEVKINQLTLINLQDWTFTTVGY